MKEKKRLWQLKPSTICKILGTVLDTKDALKLGRKFRLTKSNDLVDDELAFHSALVEHSQTENPISRHVEKLIRKRFELHAHKLSHLSTASIVQTLRTTPETLRAPLWASLWAVATADEGDKYEAALFGFVHLLEHRLVREHWRELLDQEAGRTTTGIQLEKDNELGRLLLDSQREIDALKKSNSQLQQKLVQYEAFSLRSSPADVAPLHSGCGCGCNNKQKIIELKQLLEDERQRSKSFQNEMSLFRREVEDLMQELANLNKCENSSQCGSTDSPCPISGFLDGMSIAMVGGIESLEKHYRQLIESMGGRFNRHDGYCRGGQDSLEEVISQANLVVCPIEVNSHNAARFAKKICKVKGIPCCFVKSASLASLKRTVEDSLQKASAA